MWLSMESVFTSKICPIFHHCYSCLKGASFSGWRVGALLIPILRKAAKQGDEGGEEDVSD